MSLVVAQQKGSVIAVVSDTGVTEHDKQLPPERQVPKIAILNPDLAVAFAGNPDLAKRYIDSFPISQNYQSTAQYFLKCHHDANGQVDFLALFNNPVPKIVLIRSGKVHPPMRTAWIGDHAALEAFQRCRNLQHRGSTFEAVKLITIFESEVHRDNVTFPLIGALRGVIIDPAIRSVFGFPVAVNNVDGEFQYRQYTFLLDHRDVPLLLPVSFIRRTAPELAELRNYAASCFVTRPDANIRALAYHFAHGKLTYMYWGEKGKSLSNYRVVTGRNIVEFVEQTQTEFAIEWAGTVHMRTRPPPDYGVPPQRWEVGGWPGYWKPQRL